MKRHIAPRSLGRVHIRLIEPSDSEMTLSWRNRDEVRQWFKTSVVLSFAQHTQWLEKYWQRDDDFIFIAETNKVPVGQVAVYGIDWKTLHAEVGRFIAAPEARGQGLIFEACKALLLQCKEVLGLKQVFLEVKQRNLRAIHLYNQLGFVTDGGSDGMLRMTYNF